ncbi:carbohydrate esterase family 9 protein [Mycena floridula]|nr:carbohydrate esterase family 9 protein [Mycena floridula]
MEKVYPVQRTKLSRFRLGGCLVLLLCSFSLLFQYKSVQDSKSFNLPLHAAEILEKCRSLHDVPEPSKGFYSRTKSDRFVPGTRPTLIKNATIWTGGDQGNEIVMGDILLHNGIIKGVGRIQASAKFGSELVTVDAAGRWVTPGLVDLHSHLGVDSSPALRGASDTNSFHGITQPWLRSLDGLNTHDDAYRLSISGGLTTAVVLPGSANAIGGQAFAIKLRPTPEKTSSAMLLEPPHSLLINDTSGPHPMRWRQMKQATGENPSRQYAGTRMDTIWAFRKAYETARQLKEKQDSYCEAALSGNWAAAPGNFPDDLQWEMLVDVLRGRVKIHNHCYEAVDLDGLVRLTNEFKFSIAALHHAHEAYLVPSLLKQAYGHPPAIALFATHGGYKREAYRISEYAPKVLSEAGLKVVMKTDHPVTNSRYILYHAQQAHFFGLKSNLALASITTVPARVMGAQHRIGSVKEGYDADIVLWDSHPLNVGATPVQVFIDGIAQLSEPYYSVKPEALQSSPKTPNFDKEANQTLEYDGLPPLEVKPETAIDGKIVFTNLGSMYLRTAEGQAVEQVFTCETANNLVVVVQNGSIVCSGSCAESQMDATKRIDLEGGSIAPAFVSYGSSLGLSEIDSEPSTKDGAVPDPLFSNDLDIPVAQALDGLLFETRDALRSYRSGVSVGIVAPQAAGSNLLHGLSTAFSTSSQNVLAKGAVVQNVVALHFRVTLSSIVSVSTQIGILRNLLLGKVKGKLGRVIDDVVQGSIPIVILVESADVMSSLILLKSQVEKALGNQINMVFSGATEAHLIAEEIGAAGVGVLVTSIRPFPSQWEQRRLLPGPPLSKLSAISVLLQNNVTVAIGVDDKSQVRNTRFDVGWVALESEISKADALALATVNVEKIFGLDSSNDLVATKGGEIFDFQGKVVAMINAKRGVVDLLET